MVNGHSFILIRQIAALVRLALAEACTVPVLLVYHVYGFRNFQFYNCVHTFMLCVVN